MKITFIVIAILFILLTLYVTGNWRFVVDTVKWLIWAVIGFIIFLFVIALFRITRPRWFIMLSTFFITKYLIDYYKTWK